MRRALSPYTVACGLLVGVLGLIVFANSWGVFQTDIKPEVYLAPGEMLPRYLSAWTTSPYLGSPNFNVGLVPVLAVTAALRGIGLDAELTFKVFHLALWLLAAWGANRLLRSILPGAPRWAGLAAGVAYLANPYTVTAGATLAIALPLALLPWQLLAVLRAFREPTSWRWPAAAALIFALMSGMNVAVVPVFQLLLLLPLALMVRLELGRTWREIGRVLLRTALFIVLLSLYWLLPAIAAAGTGGQIVEGSETLEGIAKVGSFPEVLRGLGLWSLYGQTDAGAWIPQYASYLTNPAILLISLLWPTLALLALRWTPARITRLVVPGVGLVAVVMVGLYPGEGASPFALVLRWVFEHVTPLLAFRTTNKIGAGLALLFALALGVAAVRVLPRLLRRPGIGQVTAVLGVLLVGTWSLPATTGDLYISPLDVPDYWREAAQRVDDGSDASRVLLLPGQTRSHYRWSLDRPDDLPNSLFTRDAIIPETTPNTSPPGANFLAALDDSTQRGGDPTQDVSTYARYLGADQVLLRHDIVWERTGGARPATTATALGRDRGLVGLANIGQAGENLFTRSVGPISSDEAVLPPLQLYGVSESRPMVRASSLSGTVVVAGDAWALPPAQRSGLLDGAPAIRYAQDLDADTLATLLGSGQRMLLTDTNQRRAAITNRLVANQGPLLPPDAALGVTRTLGEDPQDQTVLRTEGVQVDASDAGSTFFDLPQAVGEHAIDGDPGTAWLFGDFERAPGTTLAMALPESRRLGDIDITQTDSGPVKIDEVTVTAGGRSKTVALSDGTTTLDLGGVDADEVTLTVDSLRGDGFNVVGISEIDLGKGLRADRVARTPSTLDRLYGQLSGPAREDFAATPLDVAFQRVRGGTSPGDDAETGLRRDFSLPDDRTYRGSARVRVTGSLEETFDRLVGQSSPYTARSSRTFFDSTSTRASLAADGDRDTGWVPGGQIEGTWWQISGPQRDVEQVAITQSAGPNTDAEGTRYISRVDVFVDGRKVTSGEVGRGQTTLTLPTAVRGEQVRVVNTAASGPVDGIPASMEIDTGARTRFPGRVADDKARCLPVATIDGERLLMRPTSLADVGRTDREATSWQTCDATSLTWGEHRLRPVTGLQLDELRLRDAAPGEGGSATGRTAGAAPPPVVESTPTFGGGSTVEVGPSVGPYYLITGQGYDPRWRASIDGEDLGEPVVVDGYSTAWRVEGGDAATIDISYGPQRWATAAQLISLLGLLFVLGLLIRPWLLSHRRRPTEQADAEAMPETETETEAVSGTGVGVEATPEGADAHEAPTGSGASVAMVDGSPGAGHEPAHAAPSRRDLFERRVVAEASLIALALFFTGIGGTLAALAVVALQRWRPVRPRTLITVGALGVLASGVAYVIHAWGTFDAVSADAVATALIPHHIAGAGLVTALTGALLRVRAAGSRSTGDTPTGADPLETPAPADHDRPETLDV